MVWNQFISSGLLRLRLGLTLRLTSLGTTQLHDRMNVVLNSNNSGFCIDSELSSHVQLWSAIIPRFVWLLFLIHMLFFSLVLTVVSFSYVHRVWNPSVNNYPDNLLHLPWPESREGFLHLQSCFCSNVINFLVTLKSWSIIAYPSIRDR